VCLLLYVCESLEHMCHNVCTLHTMLSCVLSVCVCVSCCLKTREESRQRSLQVFAPILWSALKLDLTVPAGANLLRGSVITLLLYDVISDVFTNSLR